MDTQGFTHLWQQVKDSTPAYPVTGPIDLMKYYRGSAPEDPDLHRRTAVAEEDMRRLIWLAQVDFDKA